MITENEPWISGEPYFCKKCGAEFAQYVNCENDNCELESKEEAMKRRHDAGAAKTETEKPALMSREEIEEIRDRVLRDDFCQRTADEIDANRLCAAALAAHDIYDKAVADAAQVVARYGKDFDIQLAGAIAQAVRELKGTSNG